MSFQNPATTPGTATTPYAEARSGAVDFDPVGRAGAGLAVRAMVDVDGRRVTDAAVLGNIFRGYEVILEGRDARDGVFVSSRACGMCGGAHSACSAQALEMAFSIVPPPYAIVIRNAQAALEAISDDPVFLFGRAGPDYSEPVVRRTNPELWTLAEQTPARGWDSHGLRRMSDVLSSLTLWGPLHREALVMSRVAREAYALAGGKYPHPQTMIPGGISSTVDPSDRNLALLRLVRFMDYSRAVAAVWDDIADFFLEAQPRFSEVGAAPMNFIDPGLWDDPWGYDATMTGAPAWGAQRWSTAGAIVNGHLRTTDLLQVDAGIEEFVDRSFYEDWTGSGQAHSDDAHGNSLSAYHPWNKQTIPQPGAPQVGGKYSWSTAARWNGEPMETGAAARMWITAMARSMPHDTFIESTGQGLRMRVAQAELPASEVEWRIPASWNALERLRARAYSLVHATMVAYDNFLIGYDLTRKGGPDSKITTKFTMTGGETAGVGWWGGGRGLVNHYVQVDGKVIQRYQIVGPGTFTGSPRDRAGKPGPIESAVMATPLLSTEQPEACIDVLRAIRSFDPCMACAAQ